MSCCGARRQAFKAWLVSRPIRLRFIAAGVFQSNGAATGRTYLASETAPEVEIDPRDAKQILATGKFVVVR